jgi:hypothetical protein
VRCHLGRRRGRRLLALGLGSGHACVVHEKGQAALDISSTYV